MGTNKEKRNTKVQENSNKEQSLSPFFARIETEGERIITRFIDLLEEHLPKERTQRLEEFKQQTGIFLKNLSHAVDESASKTVERLNLPTRTEWDEYRKKVEETTRHWRANLDDPVRRALSLLDILSREDIDEIRKEVKGLKKRVDAMGKQVPGTKPSPGKIKTLQV